MATLESQIPEADRHSGRLCLPIRSDAAFHECGAIQKGCAKSAEKVEQKVWKRQSKGWLIFVEICWGLFCVNYLG
jgi:hypothetical protein